MIESITDRPYKIMLVEPDADILEILVASLTRSFDAHITCVADAASCLDVEILEPHDLVISEQELPNESGITLAEKLLGLSNRPVMLLAEEFKASEVIEALRTGVTDIFLKPFPVQELIVAAEQSLQGYQLKRRRARRYHSMRELVRRVVRERRNLNQRMELVCRDLVGAQKQLIHRISAIEETRP